MSFATLYDYNTAAALRPATSEELAASIEAAQHDGGAGVIRVTVRGKEIPAYVVEA